MSYAHRANAFWTGFYTSRPGIKFYERSLGALYQVSKIFLSQNEKYVSTYLVNTTIEHRCKSCVFLGFISSSGSHGFIATS